NSITCILPAGAPAPTAPPANPQNPCPSGQYLYNGQCIPTGTAGANDILTQVATASGNAGNGPLLSMDQWCFYYNQIRGDGTCPDPGNIPDSTYQGAGVVSSDGTPYRQIPIDVNTWW